MKSRVGSRDTYIASEEPLYPDVNASCLHKRSIRVLPFFYFVLLKTYGREGEE